MVFARRYEGKDENDLKINWISRNILTLLREFALKQLKNGDCSKRERKIMKTRKAKKVKGEQVRL